MARDHISVTEAGGGGNALVAAVTKEGARSVEDVITKGASTATRSMTSEDCGGSRSGGDLTGGLGDLT